MDSGTNSSAKATQTPNKLNTKIVEKIARNNQFSGRDQGKVTAAAEVGTSSTNKITSSALCQVNRSNTWKTSIAVPKITDLTAADVEKNTSWQQLAAARNNTRKIEKNTKPTAKT